MLVATAVATSAIKDNLPIEDAHRAVLEIQRSHPVPPAEFAVLLLISRDVEESLAVAQQRDPEPWNGRYLRYQRALHDVLMQQVDCGVYSRVIEWGSRTRVEIHGEILAAVDEAVPDAG